MSRAAFTDKCAMPEADDVLARLAVGKTFS